MSHVTSTSHSAVQVQRHLQYKYELTAFVLEPLYDLMNKSSNSDPINRTLASESGPQQVFRGIPPKQNNLLPILIHPYPSLSWTRSYPRISAPMPWSFPSRCVYFAKSVARRQGRHSMRTFTAPCPVLHAVCTVCISNAS